MAKRPPSRGCLPSLIIAILALFAISISVYLIIPIGILVVCWKIYKEFTEKDRSEQKDEVSLDPHVDKTNSQGVDFMDLFGKKAAKRAEELEARLNSAKAEIERMTAEAKHAEELESHLNAAENKLKELHYDDFIAVKAEMERITAEAKRLEDASNSVISQNNAIIARLNARIEELQKEEEKLSRQNNTAAKRLAKSKELYQSTEYAISRFFENDFQANQCKLSPEDSVAYDELSPSVILKLHVMDVKSLRKAFRDNDKQIESLLSKYSARYTTKANLAIYRLMVIALRAELQNILYNLKYEKLDTAIDQVKSMTAKYLAIASEGNQSIAGTITKFIGEIEYLFINAVKIEYNYYVKKEQARQEQLEIRERMKQEAAERKALEEERKRVEAEEHKYNEEIERIRQQMSSAAEAETEKLNKRILELQGMLSDVAVKKEDIVRLQNGKAGNIYVISNLGSFGENVFKVGMTRRLNPQDRIDELGSASVPFKFDVHSFIFSEDAVSLESRLHEMLNDHRVNKVNLRKEFFYSTVDELEELVTSIDPTAEFTKTMLAEEFRQSQSTDTDYTTEFIEEDEDDE